jgi:hypothetical protein
MTTENKYHQFDEDELKVLAYLKNMKQYAPDNFGYLIYYGVSAREMIKFLEHPEKYGDFDFSFVCNLFTAIRKTYKNSIIERPEVPVQTTEDKIIASILKTSNNAFKTLYANERMINKSHLIAYLTRDEVIWNWNNRLLLVVQKKVEELKAEMGRHFDITG